jgi:nucleoside recognition membrane protein YjiH
MITFGTVFLVIADLTPILDILAYPLSWLLEIIGVPEAPILGGAAIFAFIDQYLAVAYAQMLFSESARFLCICLATVGLINLTEIGIHVWHSSIPVTFWQMTVIYLMRIVMSMFILVPLSLYFFS